MIKTWLLDEKKRRAVAGRFGVILWICEKKFGLMQQVFDTFRCRDWPGTGQCTRLCAWVLLFVDGKSLVGPFGLYALHVFDVGGSRLAVVLCDFVGDHGYSFSNVYMRYCVCTLVVCQGRPIYPNNPTFGVLLCR